MEAEVVPDAMLTIVRCKGMMNCQPKDGELERPGVRLEQGMEQPDLLKKKSSQVTKLLVNSSNTIYLEQLEQLEQENREGVYEILVDSSLCENTRELE